MAWCDFAVKYDPAVDSKEELGKRILYSIIVKRLIHKKPAVVYIGGDSGEGKSFAALRLQEIMGELCGFSLKEFLDVMNVYTPLQYPEKLSKLLFDKDFKRANLICMHEAREIVKAKQWHSFLAQAIGDINAQSRSIKRLLIIIISQFIRDITTDVRYTLNYYVKASRPKGKNTRLYWSVMWKDDRDLEKPKLRKRKLSGYLVYPDGRYRRFVPKYLIVSKPAKEVVELFEKQDKDAKVGVIKRKISKLISEMRNDLGVSSKVDGMVDWYSGNRDSLRLIGRLSRGRWRLNKDVRDMHELSVVEVKEFEEKLNDRLSKQEKLEGVEVG